MREKKWSQTDAKKVHFSIQNATIIIMLTCIRSSSSNAAGMDTSAGISPEEQVETMSQTLTRINSTFVFFSVIFLRIPEFFGPEIFQVVHREAVRPSLPAW